MDDNPMNIDDLSEKLDALVRKQHEFTREISALRTQITQLKDQSQKLITPVEKREPEAQKPILKVQAPVVVDEKTAPKNKMPREIRNEPIVVNNTKSSSKSELEKFVGENLISKVGIAILIIGVAFGTKYSIDHDLVSPSVRIMLGYIVGLVLLAVGIKLKDKYRDYGAVLVSGAFAVMYFITYSAYSFYGLLGQPLAFAMMIVFTISGVYSALKFNRQIIAQIGLVGAYAIPVLLSEGSDNVQLFFSYIAIINIGILIIAFQKYWKPLLYTSFALTWAIYLYWFVFAYDESSYFTLGFTFLIIFFTIFYCSFLAYKLIRKEALAFENVFLLLSNAFLFFGLGSMLIDDHFSKNFSGLFAVLNAVIHAAVGFLIYRLKSADKSGFYLLVGLSIVFFTIAIPIQFDANWVTLLWTGEAALLYWIGRSKNIRLYEKLSYSLMIMAFLSLGQDWIEAYKGISFDSDVVQNAFKPVLNISFFTSVLFIIAFTFIYYTEQKEELVEQRTSSGGIPEIMSYVIPSILVLSAYLAVRLEIEYLFEYLNLSFFGTKQLEDFSAYNVLLQQNISHYETISVWNFTLMFVTVLTIVNFKKIRKPMLTGLTFILTCFAFLLFLTEGLYALSEVREGYLEATGSLTGKVIGIRYISLLCVAISLFVARKFADQKISDTNYKIPYEFLLHTTILWVISSELLHWMDIFGNNSSYKLGLSILWGLYALTLIILGIWKSKKYLRVGAIVLFGITLLKLFLYDMSTMDTIAKTIVFVSLGILLLVISFLYNKFKHKIFGEDEKVSDQ